MSSPVTVPAGVLTRAVEVAGEIGVTDAAVLVGGRAPLLGLQRGGRVSAGGATRLLTDGRSWCALTLSRPDDVDAVPALVACDEVPADIWAAVARCVDGLGVVAFTERARLLGLPVGILGEASPARPVIRQAGPRSAPVHPARWLVADLSSMWAGPLCGRLLARAGATVVKVESPSRPDGTRAGPAAFFDWVNAGKLSYVADLADDGLRDLLTVADVVIESSRPSALARLGLGPDDLPARSGRIWVRVTGHGGSTDWAAFGDDAAVAGGLVSGRGAGPEFCGDAIADPLTGLQAAAEVWRSRACGGGEVVTLSMAAVAAQYAAYCAGPDIDCGTAPSVTSKGPARGADNDLVARLVAQRRASC